MMSIKVIKRNGLTESYNPSKILRAVTAAFEATGETCKNINDVCYIVDKDIIEVEEIQDKVEQWLMQNGYYQTAKAFMLYREAHSNTRFLLDRLDYIQHYIDAKANAAQSSETDENANVLLKNVANLNGEVYKSTNRRIQRLRMKNELTKQHGTEIAKQYIKDLEHHIIYTHDESSFPVAMPYCSAYTLYPLMLEGVGNIDDITPGAPSNLDSFCGQFVNLVFGLASQVKGAVAFGGLFVAFNWYCIKEWGPQYYKKAYKPVYRSVCKTQRSIEQQIKQYFQQIIWTINQPQQNRSSQSPFTNVSYYDKNYYNAMFEEFAYPDGERPTWKQIDYLQRLFMNTLNDERLRSVIAFPVETMCLLSDDKDILDKDYKEFTAEMYAKGHSFFTYISDSPTALASCCRLRNEILENNFSFTSGLSGLKTGSCNVITLNLNRIVQDWNNTKVTTEQTLTEYLTVILERVYKYHIAYKTILYSLEEKGLYSASNAGYIRIQDLYSTIGLNGINEAAMFLGITVGNNTDYRNFCRRITALIQDQNKKHSTPKFRFNTEFVPAESLGAKNFQWDKEEGYWVPEDGRVLYNSYFYDAHNNTSIIDKFKLHGREFTKTLDGGVGCHINLDSHLTKNQYLKLIELAVKEGTSYFTFNIPNTKCNKCGHITKHNVNVCPKCGSENLTKYTRVIGYLRPTTSFSEARQIEASHRVYHKTKRDEIFE